MNDERYFKVSIFLKRISFTWLFFLLILLLLVNILIYSYYSDASFFTSGLMLTSVFWLVVSIFPNFIFYFLLKKWKKDINFNRKHIPQKYFILSWLCLIGLISFYFLAFLMGDRDYCYWKRELLKSLTYLVPLQIGLFLFIQHLIKNAKLVIQNIFISYTQADHVMADLVKNFFEGKKFTVILDTANFEFGKDILKSVNEKLLTSDLVIGLISARSLQSDWLIYEAMKVVEMQKEGHYIQYIPAKIADYDSDIEKIWNQKLKKGSTRENNLPTNFYQENLPTFLSYLQQNLYLDLSTKRSRDLDLKKLINQIHSENITLL